MPQTHLSNLLLQQSKDLIWIINPNFELVYGNSSYLSFVKMVTGHDQKLTESAFVENFGEVYIKKWKSYCTRALTGESFEIEEHYYHPETKEIHYVQITLEPLTGEDNKIVAVACQSKDITRILKQRSEANQMMDSSLDVFCTINEQGNFVFVSAAAVNHWGYLPQELIGKPYKDLILEEDIPKTAGIAAAILSGQEIKSFVNRYKKKDGSIAYNLWSVRWDPTSKLMYAVARDAKEMIEEEEKNQQSEERFKALVQEGSDLIGILDAEGNYKYVSPTSTVVLGIAPEEFIGRNAFEFIHPEDVERTLGSLQKIAIENRVMVEPFRFQNHKKEWRWIETVLTNMLDNPAVNGIVANSRDITEKIAEKHALKLLESVITNTNDAILITEAEPFDEPGPRIIYVNEAFTKMTGYAAAEVIGKSPRMLQGANSNKEELAKLGRALRNWEPYEITTINYKKSGEEFWTNFTVTPVADEKGWYTHWIAIERDVTEQKIKELENELLAQISVNFNVENDYATASKELCKSVSIYGKFDWVEVWIANLEKSQMQLFSHYVPAPDDEKFYDYSPDANAMQLSKGLAGNVWAARTQLLWNDIENHQDFLRRDAAKKIGLKSVLGIPLIFNDEVVAVLKIGTKHDADYLKKYGPIFKKLERFIGSELRRKKLENDLSHLFNTIPDILCLLDFEGRFLKMNKSGCELMGYKEEAILYHRFEEFAHLQDKGILTSEVMQFKEEQTTFEFESRFITKGGEIVWLSWHCNVASNEGLIYATANNITEEKKLRELNRQAGRLAKIGSWEVDLVNQSVFWSDEVHHLHETDPESFLPNLETGINFYREDYQQLVKEKVEKCVATGEPFDFEAVLVTATKKELWVRVIGNGEFADGKCKRIYGSFQDINSLKESENRLLSLSENIPGVVYQYIMYPDGTDSMHHISGMVKQLWGYTTDEVMGNINLLWDQIKLGGDIEAVKASILKSIQTKSKWTCRFKMVMPTGELKTHLGNGSPTFLADGSIVFNVIILDITQEAKNEALLSQASQLARIGSWEMDLINQEGESMYWSPMLFDIVEVDESYNPTLTGCIEFHIGESKERIQKALDLLIKDGVEFDEQILLLTAKGNERWSRAIGKSEIVNNKRTKIYGSYQDIHFAKSLELRISEILGSISDAFYALDKDWTFTYINKEAERLLQSSEKEVIGKNKWELFPSTVGTRLYEMYHKITQTLVPETFEYLYPADEKWYEVSAYPSAGGLSVYFKNIDERKVAAEKLQKAFEEKNKILESIGDAFFAVDNHWIVTYWNKEAELVLGRKKEQIVGKHLWEEFTDAMDTDFYRQYYKAVETRQAINFEAYYATLNKWIEVSAYPAEEGLSVYFKDVTLRKEAEVQLHQANERFEKVTEATNDAVWDWDIVNQTFYRSKAIERFLGKHASTSFKENDFWKEHFHPEDLSNIQDSIQVAIANPLTTRWELEYRVFNENGKTLYVIDRGVIIRNSVGKAIRMVGAMTNISEQKQMTVELSELNQSLQQHALELERSNEELEQFAFVASHDLQEPLRMISSFMDLLQRKYGDLLDEKGHQYIHFATDGAKRMKQIILDLLEYSRASRPTEGKEEVDLNEVLSEFKLLRRKLIAKKKATITSQTLPALNTYKAAVTQVFHCLLDNAIKYAKAGTAPIVQIDVAENEQEWKFSIKDNGIGIDPEFYDKIFAMFQRLHNKDEYDGTGIGLSIAKRHVEFLGGRIWLESAPGEGTVFYFTIPIIKN